jgi:hypothetical protein
MTLLLNFVFVLFRNLAVFSVDCKLPSTLFSFETCRESDISQFDHLIRYVSLMYRMKSIIDLSSTLKIIGFNSKEIC